jgi:hypothetical protein
LLRAEQKKAALEARPFLSDLNLDRAVRRCLSSSAQIVG